MGSVKILCWINVFRLLCKIGVVGVLVKELFYKK